MRVLIPILALVATGCTETRTIGAVVLDAGADLPPDATSKPQTPRNLCEASLFPAAMVLSDGSSVATGDFDSDGSLDLAIAKDQHVEVHLFQKAITEATLYPTNIAAHKVLTGDFNGDGILDLAVVGGDIAVLPGKGSGGSGDGTFDTPLVHTIAWRIATEGVVARDFDNDGNLDVAAVGCATKSVPGPDYPPRCEDEPWSGWLALGKGDGTFGQSVSFDVGDGSVKGSLVAADFNDDGMLDLATTHGLLLGQGETFSAPVFYSGVSFGDLATGDFNGDGIMDLVGTNTDSDNVGVLLGNGSGGKGDGTFGSPVISAAGDYPRHVVTGDFDHDGIVDLAVDSLLGELRILRGAGNGTFSLAGTHAGLRDPSMLDTVDLDKNGAHDFVMVGSDDVAVLMNPKLAPRYSIEGDAKLVIASDLNNDGITDLALATVVGVNARLGTTVVRVSVLLGNKTGDGTFPGLQTLVGYGVPTAIAAGDLNGDKIVDLLVGSVSFGVGVTVLLGKGSKGVGTGTFDIGARFDALAWNPGSFVTGDFNADGHLDLVVGNAEPIAVGVMLGTGTGGFSHWGATLALKSPLAAGDFNADGVDDLVMQKRSEWPVDPNCRDVEVLLGDGKGSFNPPVTYAVGGWPSSAVAHDLDGDKIQDLVVAAGNDLAVLYGNGANGKGDGTFTLVGIHSADVDEIEKADVNADGAIDLIDNSGDGFSVMLGGGGKFSPPFRFKLPGTQDGIAVGDFNSDGVPDVATISSVGDDLDYLSIFFGRGGSCK